MKWPLATDKEAAIKYIVYKNFIPALFSYAYLK